MRKPSFSLTLQHTLLFAAVLGWYSSADGQRLPRLREVELPPVVVVNAYQVYMACRHPDAYRNEAGENGKLYRFCHQNLPGRDQWLDSDSVTQWINSVPSAAEIARWATKSREFNINARQVILGTQSVRGNDESGGNITFEPGISDGLTLTADGTLFLRGLTGRLSEEVRLQRAVGVVIGGPPGGPNSKATRRMRLVRETLQGDESLRTAGVELMKDATRDSLFENGSIAEEVVTVHLLYKSEVMPRITALGEIRFDPSRSDLDSDDIDVIAAAAREIIAADVPAGMPIVITGQCRFRHWLNTRQRTPRTATRRRYSRRARGHA